MNDAEQRVRGALTNVPFDDAFRREHRDQVRELALQAFDEAAGSPQPKKTTTRGSEFVRPRMTRRSAVRWAITGLAAASVCGAMFAWLGRSDDEVSQNDAVTHADQKFIAALNVLSEYEPGVDAATFDQGVQMCLAERSSELAATGL